MVSIVYQRRAIPVYFTLLEKKGNSNLQQQLQVLEPVLNLFKDYKITVLGEREFCGVELAKCAFFQDVVQELLSFYPHKQPYYLKGMKAASLIRSAL
jgi:hypothetical protein